MWPSPSIDAASSARARTFVEIVERLAAGDIVARLSGHGERGDGGPPTRRSRDLNEFRAHDYSLIPVERYFALKEQRQIDYISSQGCRFRCAFCADPAVYERGWTGLHPSAWPRRSRPAPASYGIDEVAFQDETFFTHPPRVDALADEFLRRGTAITWTATLRADQACRLGEELFAKCGPRRPAARDDRRRVGLAGDARSAEEGHEARAGDDTAEMCARHDVGAIFNFIVGFPGETDDQHARRWRWPSGCAAMHPAVRDADLLLPAVSPGIPSRTRARRAT